MTPTRDGEVADGSTSAEGTLGDLIELEEQIEAQVVQAKAEAQRIVAEARQSARAAEEDGTASLEDAVGALRESIDAECTASVRVLRERAEAEAERYRRVDDETLTRLSRKIASRALSGAEHS
jgi:F0F1-type ATP synthase membrane subunit b/b'